MSAFILKRIYDQPEAADGRRVLVDRIWPRGVSKESAQLTQWMKEVAPSKELCVWFGHIPEKFVEFKARYRAELSAAAVQPYLKQLESWAKHDRVTLLYAAKDERFNQAVVLKEYLERRGEE